MKFNTSERLPASVVDLVISVITGCEPIRAQRRATHRAPLWLTLAKAVSRLLTERTEDSNQRHAANLNNIATGREYHTPGEIALMTPPLIAAAAFIRMEVFTNVNV